MNLRVPLFAKILLWFLLNLVVVGALLYAFAGAQLHLGLDSLLAGRAGDRMDAVAEVIAAELRSSPRDLWDETLDRFSDAYHVQFAAFRPNGDQVSGEPVALPEPVRARLPEVVPPPRRPPAPGLPPGPPGRDFDPPFPEGRPRGEPLPPEVRAAPGHDRKIMVHTRTPSRYWVLTHLRGNEPPQRGEPLVLIAISDSLSGGGLFFEFTPWIIVGLAVLFVSILWWLPLVHGITHALSRLTSATGQIAEGRFDVRVAEGRRDELGSLARSVNRMAARLDGFLTGQKRFLGDIAHELCAPIARLQVALGILDQRADDRSKAYVADLAEEIDHMSTLVNELLSFSKASLAGTTIKLGAVAVLPVVEKALRREASPEANVTIDVPADLAVTADSELLLRALSNILRNAIRYAASAGPIAVTATSRDGLVAISVADCGPGIPEEALSKVFDPFYRVDVSRDRATGGAGLGLAIVKTCVESCGGTVSCRRREPTGLAVTLVLPAG